MIYLSASQINQWECQRKWGWSYLANIKTPQHPAAALGTEVDDTQLQPYLRDGRPFDYTRESGYIAASILGYLPPPKTPGMGVQTYFEMPSPTWVGDEHIGFGFRGYKDLTLPDTGLLPDMEGGRPCVVDFKTTSNFRWAKTPETLATDVQAMTYAAHTMFSTGAREVDLVWLYMQTKGARKAKRVHLRVNAKHVAEQFTAINNIAIEMFEKRVAFEALGKPAEDFVLHELQPNPDQCEAYGGCPYRSKCNLSPDQIVEAYAAKHEANRAKGTSDMTVDLLASLRARKAGAVQDTTVSITNGSPPVLDTPSKPGGPLPGNIPAAFAGINPPESLLPPAPPVGSAPIALVEPVVAIEKAKRGRPSGSKNVPKDPIGADVAAHTTKAVDPYEAAIERAGLSEYELRADAVRELASAVGQALLKFCAQLEVTK